MPVPKRSKSASKKAPPKPKAPVAGPTLSTASSGIKLRIKASVSTVATGQSASQIAAPAEPLVPPPVTPVMAPPATPASAPGPIIKPFNCIFEFRIYLDHFFLSPTTVYPVILPGSGGKTGKEYKLLVDQKIKEYVEELNTTKALRHPRTWYGH